MKKIIAVLAVLIVTGAWGYGQGVAISKLVFSSALQGGSVGAELINGSDTTVRFQGGSSGWIDIGLAGPYLIGKAGLSVEGGEGVSVHWQFETNGTYRDFFARRSGDVWDLSFENLVTEKIRLSIEAADLSQVRLSRLSIQGRDVGTIWNRIQPMAVKGTPDGSSFYPVTNLFDGNTQTIWKVRPTFHDDEWDDDDACRFFHDKTDGRWGPRNDWGSVAWADLGTGKHLHRIDVYFDEEARAAVIVQGLIDGSWQELGRLAAQPGQWASLDNPKKQALISQIKFTLSKGIFDWGSIGEISLWGIGAYGGDEYPEILAEGNLVDGGRFAVFSKAEDDPRKACYEFAVRGEESLTPSLAINGSSRPVRLLASNEGISYFRADGLETALNDGENFVSIHGVGTSWVSGRVRLPAFDGRIRADWGVPELSDGWHAGAWTGESFVKAFSPAVSFGRLRLVGNGQLLMPDGAGGWTEGEYISEDGGKLYSSWGDLSQVDVTAGEGGIGEIETWGDLNEAGAASVEVLWPKNGQSLSRGDCRSDYLIGEVDREGVEVRVNGHKAWIHGNIFTIPLRTLDLDRKGLTTISVQALKDKDILASRSIGVLVGEDPDDIVKFWFDSSRTITTESETYKLSGWVEDSNVRILAGSEEVPVVSDAFTYTVSLQFGINTITIYAFDVKTGAVIKKATVTIVRFGPGIILSLDGEGSVAYVSATRFTVTGTVISKNRVKVTVNGKAANVDGYRFAGQPIALSDGMNTLSVTADDRIKPVTKTLQVFLDRSKPGLSITQPVANTFYSHAVPVNGKVISADPDRIVVNGVSYDASSGSFSLTIPMTVEGAFVFKLQPVNKAGTTGSEVSIPLKIDNTPPARFIIAANITGWTSNNQPTISFSTTDSYSGISHYEVRLDSGSWTSQASPYKLPLLSDGVHQVQVKALDVAGNASIESIELKIDTTPPVAVSELAAIPGSGLVEVIWKTVNTDVVRYHVVRLPAWSDGEHIVSVLEFTDTGLSNGEVYSYQVWAEDRAANMGPITQTRDTISGLAVQVISSDPQQSTVVDYKGMEVVIPPAALPEEDKVVLIQKIDSPKLKDASSYPILGPIYSLSTLALAADGTLSENTHTEFSKEVVVVLDYDDSQVPIGFPEANLGVYYFDTTWNKWFLVERSAVDRDQNKIVFLTNHFTAFSVQPTMIQDLSPQQLKDAGHSPFKAESSTGAVTVSPQGGTAMVEVTEFVLQGKNGFTLPIKRMYDTATAMVDSPSVSLSASISLGAYDLGSLGSLAYLAGQLASNGTANLVGAIKSKVDGLLKHNGDYALSTGVGWRLSLPYVVTTNSTVMVRLPNGGYYGINQMESQNSFWSNPVSRTLDFQFHEGEDFHFRAVQVRDSIDVTGIAIAGLRKVLQNQEISLTNLIPGWNTIACELWTKDGTYYLFDGNGRVVQIKDKTGFSSFDLTYNGLLLSSITDDMGRKVNFQYDMPPNVAIFLKPVITNISTSGFEGQNRTVNYDYDWDASSDLWYLFNFLPTLVSSTDPAGRISSFTYDRRCLVAGGGSVKINFLALIFDLIPGCGFVNTLLGISTLTLSGHIEFNFPYTISKVVAPGIGTTEVNVAAMDLTQFKSELDDWFLGLIPTAIKFSYDIIYRLATDHVKVTSSTGVVQNTYYSYDWSSREYQFYVSRATTNNGRLKTVQDFMTIVHSRNRFISWDDYLTSVLQSYFSSEGLTVNEVSTLQSGSSTYDASSGSMFESVSNTWDTTHHRITASTTIRGSGARSSNAFQYDSWGNQTYVLEDSVANGRENKCEKWMWYLNSGSSAPSVWALPSLGADETLSNGEIHDLLKGTFVRGYRPAEAGGGFDERAQQYLYNSYGLKKSEGLWLGDHWARTDYEYFTDTGLLSSGMVKSKIGPNPDQKTVWEYDFTRSSKDFFIATQTVQNVADPTGNGVNVVSETVTDWRSGWKLYEKDSRGYVTEYGYDKLGRATDTIRAGEEAPLSPGSWNVTHTNSPWDHIVYNDTALTATVYKSSFSSGANNAPGKAAEVYRYDNLGQLIQIDKFNYLRVKNGALVTLAVVEDSKTLVTYSPWGDVASVTDPNGHTTIYGYDAKGRPSLISYPDGAHISTVYDDSQNLKTTTDERRVITQEWVTWKGNTQTKIVDPSGINAVTQTYYNGLEEVVAVVDPLGQKTVTWYSPFGKPREVRHPPVDVWQSPSSASSSLPTVSLTSVVPTEITLFDDAGQAIRQQTGHPGNYRSTDFTYDTAGRTIKKTVGTREEWSWYDAAGNLVKHADPLVVESIKSNNLDLDGIQGISLTSYSSRNQVTSETDPTGGVVRYRYDLKDRKTQMKDPRSNPDPSVSDSFTLNYTYNDFDRLVLADLPPVAGQPRGKVQISYDLRGNAVEQIDPAGKATVWTYDPRNRKTSQSITGSDGTGPIVTAWGYDAKGNPVREIVVSSLNTAKPELSSGLVTAKIYDSLNRLTDIYFPDGREEHLGLDLLGRATSTTDAMDYTTNTVFNSLNKPTSVTDPDNNVTSTVYDVWAEPVQSMLGNPQNGNQVWVRGYNQYGELVYEQNNLGQQWAFSYDSRGLVIQAMDPNQTTVTSSYDNAGRIISKSFSNGSRFVSESWSYDAAGSLKSATEGSVLTQINWTGTTYVPDPYDLINSYSTSIGSKNLSVSYTYDNAHNVTSITYPDNSTISYLYNGLGQLTDVPSYATGGLYNFMGRLTSLSATNRTQRTKSWDPIRGTLDGYDWHISEKTSRALAWDNRGNLINLVKEGHNSSYGYDKLNRLVLVNEDGEFEVNSKDIGGLDYGRRERDVAGRNSLSYTASATPVKLDYHASSVGINLQTSRNVNKVRLVGVSPRISPRTVELYTSNEGTSVSWSKVTDTTWMQDETGVTLQLKDSHQAQFVKVHMTWDERDGSNRAIDNSTIADSPSKLIQVWFTVNGHMTSWTYDALGNRLTEYDAKGSYTNNTEYSYYPGSSRIKQAGSWAFNYDANGNLTSRGNQGTWDSTTDRFTWDEAQGEVWQYSYDLKNRLIQVDHSLQGANGIKTAARYAYNIRDLRIQTTKGSTVSYYQYDLSGDLLWTEDGIQQRKYIEVLGQIWAEVRTSGTTTTIYWHHTDHEGTTNVVTDSSGKIVWDAEYEAFGEISRSNGSIDFKALYTGRELDPDTGLYYTNARWYDPQLGRFITEDPARDGNNWYAYVNNNPMAYTDPTGLLSFKDIYGEARKIGGTLKRGTEKAVKAVWDRFIDAKDAMANFVSRDSMPAPTFSNPAQFLDVISDVANKAENISSTAEDKWTCGTAFEQVGQKIQIDPRLRGMRSSAERYDEYNRMAQDPTMRNVIREVETESQAKVYQNKGYTVAEIWNTSATAVHGHSAWVVGSQTNGDTLIGGGGIDPNNKDPATAGIWKADATKWFVATEAFITGRSGRDADYFLIFTPPYKATK